MIDYESIPIQLNKFGWNHVTIFCRDCCRRRRCCRRRHHRYRRRHHRRLGLALTFSGSSDQGCENSLFLDL